VGDGETVSDDGEVLDAYSHVLPGMQEKAVEAMNDVLSKNGLSKAKGLKSTWVSTGNGELRLADFALLDVQWGGIALRA
jgi:hypothetical protein